MATSTTSRQGEDNSGDHGITGAGFLPWEQDLEMISKFLDRKVIKIEEMVELFWMHTGTMQFCLGLSISVCVLCDVTSTVSEHPQTLG